MIDIGQEHRHPQTPHHHHQQLNQEDGIPHYRASLRPETDIIIFIYFLLVEIPVNDKTQRSTHPGYCEAVAVQMGFF